MIQIRDVPDDVDAALTEAAAAQGLSLTKYLFRELQQVAQRAQVVRATAVVARQTQAEVLGRVDRGAILEAPREGRGESCGAWSLTGR